MRIRDPGWNSLMRIRDPDEILWCGSGILDEILWCGSGILDEILWCGSGIRMKFFDADPGSWMKFFDADPGSGWNSLMRIRDPGRKLYVSGIREGNYTYPGSGMEKSRIRDSGSGMNVSDLEHLNYYAPFLFDVVFTFRIFFPGSDLLRKRICFNCKMWLPVTNAGRKIRLNFPIMIRYSDLIDRYKIRFFQKKKKKNI
jgi:hypothetical protein